MSEQTLFGLPWSTFKALPAAEKARLHALNAPRPYRAAAPLPAGPSSAPMSVEQTRQLREWGLSREQIADLAELAPGDLAKIWPTTAELEANERMGPNGPGAIALIVLKADQAGVKLPPGWQGGTR